VEVRRGKEREVRRKEGRKEGRREILFGGGDACSYYV
jgi:hypothetical protein